MIEQLTKQRRRGLLTTLPELVSFGGKNCWGCRKNREGVAEGHGHDQEKLRAKAGHSNIPCAQTLCAFPIVSYLLYFSRIGVTSLTSASDACAIVATCVGLPVAAWVGFPAAATWVGSPTWVGFPALAAWVGLPIFIVQFVKPLALALLEYSAAIGPTSISLIFPSCFSTLPFLYTAIR